MYQPVGATKMPLLKRLSDTFWGYLSPSATKTHPLKRKNMDDVNMNSPTESDDHSIITEQRPVSSRSLSHLLQRQRSLSPDSKMRFWRLAPPEHPKILSGPRIGEKRKVDKFDNLSQEKTRDRKARKTMDYAWNRKGKTADLEDEAHELVDLEGDTLMVIDGGHEGDVQSKIVDALPSREWDQMDEGDTTLINNDDISGSEDDFEDALDQDNDESADKVAFNVLPPSPTQTPNSSNTWSSDVQPLYLHIKNRGREPLLPRTWNLDFKYLPDGLFLPKPFPDTLAPIRPLNQSYQSNFSADFRAKRALQRLFDMPGRARDKLTSNLSPETLICRHVEECLSWGLLDAGLGPKTLDLVNVQTSKGIKNYEELQRVLKRKMATMAKKWRSAYLNSAATGRVKTHPGQQITMPSVYAVVVSRTTVAVMTHSPPALTINRTLSDDDAAMDAEDEVAGSRVEIKTMVMFDLSLTAYDVWNAFTLAILSCHVRDILLEIVRGGVDAGQNVAVKVRKLDEDL